MGNFAAIWWMAIYLLFASHVRGQAPAIPPILEKLRDEPTSERAFGEILKRSEKHSLWVLIEATDWAMDKNRLEDAVFLHLAACKRSAFDLAYYEPTQKGDASPFSSVTLNLNLTRGPILESILENPAALKKALERFESWQPDVFEAYDPGYPYRQRLSKEDASRKADTLYSPILKYLKEYSELINIPEYCAAVKAYKLYRRAEKGGSFELKKLDLPTTEEFEEAVKTLERIENEKGIKSMKRARREQFGPS